MSASDEFREHLRAGNFVEAMNLALGQAIELEITTWVPGEDSISGETIDPDRALKTRLNIVDGEIDNQVGAQFIGNGPYRELREFHTEQVQSGQQIIQKNLESLQQVFTILTVALARQPQASPSSNALLPSASPQKSIEHREKTY
ncbi:hypothetical protein [Oscillatoria sp. FACHB-1406]|uniref:hypothetical protein n=1 Tax=Oscillatoria sp. FACHB-1406 TaxID=2692846 RepID=UPI00168583ED|nr:hypothetical protein [Oscillatoria sp. FACHB-1406]MBD2578737.1 hypothetical protein [Oscillatoria sp. FACHB-1406]